MSKETLKIDEVTTANSQQGLYWKAKCAGKTYNFKSEVKPGDEVYAEVTESNYSYQGKPATSRWCEVISTKPRTQQQPSLPSGGQSAVREVPSFEQVMEAIRQIKNELGWGDVNTIQEPVAKAISGVMQTVILRIGAGEISPPQVENPAQFAGDAKDFDLTDPPQYSDEDKPPWAR